MLRQTKVLFAIVIIFVLSHVLRITLNIDELISLGERNAAAKKNCDWLKYWTIIIAPFSPLLLAINSSINFFIYCWFNWSFREMLLAKMSAVLVALRLKHDQTATRPATSPSWETNVIASNETRRTEATSLLNKACVGSEEEKSQEIQNAASVEEIQLQDMNDSVV